jgi:Acyltransferase
MGVQQPSSTSRAAPLGRTSPMSVALVAAALLANGSSDAPVAVHAFAFSGAASAGPQSVTAKLHRILRQRAASSPAALYPGIGLSPQSSASRGLSSTASSRTVSVNDAALSSSSTSTTPEETKKEERRRLIKSEGGRFAFDTKFGALNPYAIYYGLVSILLGLPWFVALTACQLFYAVTRNKLDPQRRIVGFITQIWGVSLMRLTRATPAMENWHILQEFYKQNRPAMFVANHNSWMDIPFLGGTLGWRNYKLVSKKELGKVPILGKAIKVGGHIMVDRGDRKSQLKTLKRGIQYLKVGPGNRNDG